MSNDISVRALCPVTPSGTTSNSTSFPFLPAQIAVAHRGLRRPVGALDRYGYSLVISAKETERLIQSLDAQTCAARFLGQRELDVLGDCVPDKRELRVRREGDGWRVEFGPPGALIRRSDALEVLYHRELSLRVDVQSHCAGSFVQCRVESTAPSGAALFQLGLSLFGGVVWTMIYWGAQHSSLMMFGYVLMNIVVTMMLLMIWPFLTIRRSDGQELISRLQSAIGPHVSECVEHTPYRK